MTPMREAGQCRVVYDYELFPVVGSEGSYRQQELQLSVLPGHGLRDIWLGDHVIEPPQV